MRRSVFYVLTTTALALSLLSFAGCKKKVDENQNLPAAAKPVEMPPATTPSGAKLPPGVTIDPATGSPKSERPGPPKVEDVDQNTAPRGGSSNGQ